MARTNKFKQRLSIAGPPLILVIVGAAVYIAVLQITKPQPQVIQAIPQEQAESEAVDESSASASLTTITTAVEEPSQTEITAWQKAADEGDEAWRLDPLQVAKRLGLEYGFAANDPFSFEQTTGSASLKTRQVKATHQGKDYILIMNQPGITGAKGIWVIESIAED